MASKTQDKARKTRRAGSAKRSPNTYEKILKRGKGNRVRTRKGASSTALACSINDGTGIGPTILNFGTKPIMLECGHSYETGHLPPDQFDVCSKGKGHESPHGNGRGYFREDK